VQSPIIETKAKFTCTLTGTVAALKIEMQVWQKLECHQWFCT